ncbi:uncharacterized protein LOC130248626 [Oenanthe melanoleuca]|uniref:uncharacterized protein LOC130248626 n=1 Tax=Oenanthe melanoleuca TaxID=2939378 RepID=UPI0024C19FB3|nr:uncharacterized protein LOC130248626 [Oenanthe melanoleuca]XP_056338484.1 uncharacterized protein LOC130248626 [Oenanthe melanoleuca]
MDRELTCWEGRDEEELFPLEGHSKEELSQWEDVIVTEACKQHVVTAQKLCRWEARRSQELHQLELCVRVQEICQCPDETHEELHKRKESVRIQELYEWEEDGQIVQEVHEWEDSDSVELARWDSDDSEVMGEDREVESDDDIRTEPFPSEEDEWDEVSVLELPPEANKAASQLRDFVAEGLPVPVPREAWVEEQEAEPCSPGPLRASSASLQGQAPVGHAASPAQPLHGQPCAPSKRPSRFRRALRALRGLFCCPCLRPLPRTEGDEEQLHAAGGSALGALWLCPPVQAHKAARMESLAVLSLPGLAPPGWG